MKTTRSEETSNSMDSDSLLSMDVIVDERQEDIHFLHLRGKFICSNKPSERTQLTESHAFSKSTFKRIASILDCFNQEIILFIMSGPSRIDLFLIFNESKLGFIYH